jgi:hypothetical protein
MITILFIFLSYAGLSQKDCDYNPYQYAREEYLSTLNELIKENIYNDCDAIEDHIKNCRLLYMKTESIDEKMQIIGSLNLVDCPKSFDILEYIILHDESEFVRCEAIKILGGIGVNLQFLIEYAQKDISDYEKIIVAYSISFNITREKVKEASLKILDSICYTENDSIIDYCFSAYYIHGGVNAIKYFEYLLDNSNYQITAAVRLVDLGEYKKMESIFLKVLECDDDNDAKKKVALRGLASIGGKDNLKIIEDNTKNKNLIISRYASFILEYIKMKTETQKGEKQ